MTWKNGRKIIAFRRERVAFYKLRGFTIREIVDALQKEGLANPETEKPFSHGTVVSDLKALHKEWMANASKDIAAHKADQLAELAELRKRNWGLMDLAEVRNCLILEAKILGTPAPDKHQIGVTLDDVLAGLPDEYSAAVRAALAQALSTERD